MTAALATIAFLSALWLAVVLVARTLEGRLGRIGAALRGEVAADRLSLSVPLRVRYPARRQRPLAARPTLRAAA